jgi:DNA-binding CsgD family transcriptional regulator
VATGGDQLVGRREELAFLRDRLADARRGSGRVVIVSGPAGIGKTRLVEELVRDQGIAGTDDLAIGWGAALADAGMPPLWPWTRALRTFPEPRAALAAVVAGGVQGEFGSAEEAAAATFAADTAVIDALEARAADLDMLLILDDLQWADGATFRLLERLATEIRRLSLLVIATHRDPAHVALQNLLAKAGTEVVRLRPLTSEEAEALLATTVDGVDPASARQAAARSGGSPLYLRTLAQVAGEQLRGQASWAETTDAPEFRHLVSAAMRAAGPSASAAVEAASALGTEAPAWLLAGLLDEESPTEAVASLRPAVPAGLIEISTTPGEEIRFAHALVRDVAYASLTPSRRAELHRRAAELLEPLAVGHDERAGMVARHWDQAGRSDRAVEWAIRAADAARAAGAYDEAAAYLSLALDASQRSPGSSVDIEVDRAELLLDLARSQYLGGRLEEAFESCHRGAHEAELTGRPEVLARAAIVIQGIGGPAMNERLASLCRRALALLDANAPDELRARVEAQLACALFETGERAEAVSWSAIALQHAAASSDANAELDAIRARATLIWLPGSDQELLELSRRAIALARLTGRPLVELLAHVWHSDAAVRLGDLAAAYEDLSEMQALAERTGLPLVRWHWLRRTATLSALIGDFARCRRAAIEAVTIAEGWHDQSIQGTHLSMMAALCALRGDPSDLPSDWKALADAITQRPPVIQAVAAEALALAGQREEAAASFHMLIRNVDRLAGWNLAALPPLTEMARLFGSPHECRALRAVVSATFKDAQIAGTGTVWYEGSVARIIGELDICCGDYQTAVAHLEEGLAVETILGARPYTVRGRLSLAHAYRATGDLTRTIELARVAAADAGELDMPGPMRDAESLLAEARAAARSADPLTPREREVAELVGQALSNREVARRLVLSERTVESHLRNILTKTGLRSRTELTRWLLANRDGTSQPFQ